MCFPCSAVVSVRRSRRLPPPCFSSPSASLLAAAVFESSLAVLGSRLTAFGLSLVDFAFGGSCFIAVANFDLGASCFPPAVAPLSDGFAPSWDWTGGLEEVEAGVEGVAASSSGGGAIICAQKIIVHRA